MDRQSLELKQAPTSGDLARVRAVVEAGADVNATDEYGSGTLLTFHPAVMEYLLSKGADPNRQTNESGDPVLVESPGSITWNVSACCCRLGRITIPSSMAQPKRHSGRPESENRKPER